MRHDVELPEKTQRQAPIEIQPEEGSKLWSIRCMVWAFAFEVALCLAAALAWSLRFPVRSKGGNCNWPRLWLAMARVSKRSECRASAPLQAFMSSCTRLDATPETYRDHARHNGVWGNHQANRRDESTP
jgi:hypothetical protein